MLFLAETIEIRVSELALVDLARPERTVNKRRVKLLESTFLSSSQMAFRNCLEVYRENLLLLNNQSKKVRVVFFPLLILNESKYIDDLFVLLYRLYHTKTPN